MNSINLFCFHYAGGSASIYYKWRKQFDDRIHLHLVELPGRGSRYREPLLDNMEDIATEVHNRIKEELPKAPFAFFGHSMGSLVAFELAHKIAENEGLTPEHIFFSGRNAPHIIDREILHTLPAEEFKEKVLAMGGTPREIFENEELREIFLPVIKADLKAVETYQPPNRQHKLNCDFTVLNGRQDMRVLNDAKGWGCYTNGKCHYHILEGGHFFIHDRFKDIIRIIKHNLSVME